MTLIAHVKEFDFVSIASTSSILPSRHHDERPRITNPHKPTSTKPKLDMSAPQQGGEDYLDKAVDKAEQMIGISTFERSIVE